MVKKLFKNYVFSIRTHNHQIPKQLKPNFLNQSLTSRILVRHFVDYQNSINKRTSGFHGVARSNGKGSS